MIIAVDFDGTIVDHQFPQIGTPLPLAFDTLKAWKAKGHELILWTCREGIELAQAVNFCEENGVTFDSVNSNAPSVEEKISSRKVYADWYVDDRASFNRIHWDDLDSIRILKQNNVQPIF